MKSESGDSSHFEIDADNLPDRWVISTMGEVAEVVAGGTPPSKDETNFSDDGYPWITPADLSNFHSIYVQRGSRSLSEKGLRTSAAKMLPKGTVLMSSRAPIGYVAIAANPISTNQGFKNFICHQNISPDYVYYWIRFLNPYLEGMGSGSTFNEISGSRAKKIPIAYPPLPEQQRIVARVEILLTQVNAARDQLNRVPLVMKRFRQGVLAAGCSGRLTEGWRKENFPESVESVLQRITVEQSHTGRQATDNIIPGDCILSVGDPETPFPEGWLRVPLTQIARLESGHTPSRKHPEYWDGEVLWIGIDDARIHHGGYIEKTIQHPTPLGLENSAARLLPPDTVCLSRTASVGYVVIMKKTMATSQDFVNWICSEAISPKFLMFAFMAEGEGIKKFGRGTTHTTIYYPEAKALHICLPPIAEQHEIVCRIETLFTRADAIEREVAAATKRTEALTQAVLAKAFRGELVTPGRVEGEA